jgi:hypothetical protein
MLELAIIRYAVVCERWQKLTPGHTPYLNAFLAGWLMRTIDEPNDYSGTGKDSFRAGWTEADMQLEIQSRHAYYDDGQPSEFTEWQDFDPEC